jgi:hypothetical protein
MVPAAANPADGAPTPRTGPPRTRAGRPATRGCYDPERRARSASPYEPTHAECRGPRSRPAADRYLLATLAYGLLFFTGRRLARRAATPLLRGTVVLHLATLVCVDLRWQQFPA